MSAISAIGSTAATGLAAATDRFERAASRIARAGTGLPGSDSDLAADIVDELEAKQSFTANVAVVRTGDQLVGTLLDVVA